MPNGNSQDNIEKLLAEQRAILEAPQSEQFARFRDYVFTSLSTVFAGLRNIRARLPFSPWLVKTLGGVTLAGIIGIAAWLVRMDARAYTADTNAREAKATATANYDKLDNRLRPAENGIVKLLADMDNLREARGVKPSTPLQRLRVRQKLGLPTDSVPRDSMTAPDSAGP